MNLFSPVKVPKFVNCSENLLSKSSCNIYNAIFCYIYIYIYIYNAIYNAIYIYIYSVHMPQWVLI